MINYSWFQKWTCAVLIGTSSFRSDIIRGRVTEANGKIHEEHMIAEPG
jgi:hypothetical protein